MSRYRSYVIRVLLFPEEVSNYCYSVNMITTDKENEESPVLDKRRTKTRCPLSVTTFFRYPSLFSDRIFQYPSDRVSRPIVMVQC